MKIFLKYLYTGDKTPKLLKVLPAIRFTISYYKQRRALKFRHRLRTIDLPYLIFLQQSFDKSNKEALSQAKKIIVPTETETSSQPFRSRISHIFSRENSKFFSISSLLSSFHLASISAFLVKHINLYHKSLESLVDGHREVTRNHDTVLPDGKTVKSKLESFESKITSHNPLKNPFK